MPQNNPDRDRITRGDTVFINSSALTELPPQLMQQDLETLVGLNIHSSDLESLQVSADGHVVDASGVLLSDGVTVGNIVEVAEEDTAMDTSDSLSGTQPMEVDSLSDTAHVINEMNLLQHGHEFIPISSREDLIDDSSNEGHSTKATYLTHGSSIKQELATSVVGESPIATQILKNSSGQFVILQPDQTSLPISSLGNKVFSSANIILSSFASSTGSKITKPTFVNANQFSGTTVRQIGNLNQGQPQFRTLQLKQPITLSSDNQNSGVTKVILTSQPGNNLSQQLRLITSQANANQSPQTILTNSSNSSNKLSFQFQPFGLSLSSAKNVVQSPSKFQSNDKSSTKIKIPFTLPLKSTPTSVQQITTLQSNDLSNQIISQNDTKVSNSLSTPQNVIIKGNIPIGTNQSNFKPGQILATSGTQLIKIPVNQLSQLSSQNQTVQLSNKMNIRLVTSNNSTSVSAAPGNTIQLAGNQIFKSFNMATSKPIAPANNNKNIKTNKTIPIQISQSPKPQRLIIPVSSSSGSQEGNSNTITTNISGIQIRPQGSITLPASALPPGVLSNAQPGSLVMIPAQYFQNATGLSNHIIQTSNQNSTTPVATSQQPKPAPTKTVIDANVIKPRKPCNCTKSQCLKLYCDCFANGEFCNNCNCVNCYNNLSHEEERQKAIKCCLERNPQAFRPKIGKGGSDSERRHNKGCNCKRSGCLKNYCECYEAKIPCSNMCKCIGCRNMDSCQPYERKRLMQLAEAAEQRVNQHIAIKNRPLTFSSLPSPAKMSLSLSAKNTYCRISQEVVEATCHCLIAQAEKVEKQKNFSQEKLELTVINEFSRCLLQIIGFNSKTKGTGVQ